MSESEQSEKTCRERKRVSVQWGQEELFEAKAQPDTFFIFFGFITNI